jgi:hypothetical protein
LLLRRRFCLGDLRQLGLKRGFVLDRRPRLGWRCATRGLDEYGEYARFLRYLWNHFTLIWDDACVARIEALLAQSMRIDMPRIDERDAAAARAIFRESEELKNFLEKELPRLEKNETFAASDFQKGAVRALIDLFRMVNGLASVLMAIDAKRPTQDDRQPPDSHIAA